MSRIEARSGGGSLANRKAGRTSSRNFSVDDEDSPTYCAYAVYSFASSSRFAKNDSGLRIAAKSEGDRMRAASDINTQADIISGDVRINGNWTDDAVKRLSVKRQRLSLFVSHQRAAPRSRDKREMYLAWLDSWSKSLDIGEFKAILSNKSVMEWKDEILNWDRFKRNRLTSNSLSNYIVIEFTFLIHLFLKQNWLSQIWIISELLLILMLLLIN